jgi:hypothetical protein
MMDNVQNCDSYNVLFSEFSHEEPNLRITLLTYLLTYSVALVRKRTIPTERPPLSAKLVPTSNRVKHIYSSYK